MSRLFFWIKTHKLSSLLILVLLFVIFNNYLKGSTRQRYDVYESPSSGAVGIQSFGALGMPAPDFSGSDVALNKSAPQESSSRTSDRMVIQNSTLSLLVNNVEQVKDMILAKTRELGGFMVSTNVNNTQDAA